MNMALDKIVPESLPWRHTDEGPDDSASHTKSSLIGSSISVPISQGKLAFGTWQDRSLVLLETISQLMFRIRVYLCEFRKMAHTRTVVATILYDSVMRLVATPRFDTLTGRKGVRPMSTLSQLQELLGFLPLKEQPHVQCIALQNLLPYSAASSQYAQIFTAPCDQLLSGKPCIWLQYIGHLLTLNEFPITGRHDILKILINQTNNTVATSKLLETPKVLETVLNIVTEGKHVLADPACMLLSNVSQFPSGQAALLKEIPRLLDTFLMPSEQDAHANFDFLPGVFANLASLPEGRSKLVEGKPGEDALSQISIFSEHPSVIRRGGVASCLKNVAFRVDSHAHLLSQDANILPRILLPLCGPEEFPIEEFDKLPVEIQLLSKEKERETDPNIRCIHLETLILLCSTRAGRERLRDQNVYRIVQLMHQAEQDERNKELATRLVGLLVREEEAQITQIVEDGGADDIVEEV